MSDMADWINEQRLDAEEEIRLVANERGTRAAQLGVQTPAAERSVPDPAPTTCPCGCGHNVPPGRKWAGEGCRQRHWNAKHTPLDLSALSQADRVRAERMVAEAVAAAKLGQRRATVDADRPVSHEAAADCPDRRPSNRVRLSEECWDALESLRTRLGLPSRSAVVEALVAQARLEET